jgi:hypothetical protein
MKHKKRISTFAKKIKMEQTYTHQDNGFFFNEKKNNKIKET